MATPTTTPAPAPAFDLDGARKSGYSDDEIIQHLAQSRNFDLAGAQASGYSKQEILDHLAGAPSATSAPTTIAPPPPPGFLTRLGQSLGVPTSMDELRALKPMSGEFRTVQSAITYPARKASEIGTHISHAVGEGEHEIGEAARNIVHGEPVMPNIGKATYGAERATLEGPLSVVGGHGLQQAGEDLAQNNPQGAAGGVVGSVINALLLRSATRGKPSPETRANKLTFAGGSSSARDFPAAYRELLPDLDRAQQAIGKHPETVGDMHAIVDHANASINQEYGLALQPIAAQQQVPSQIYNDIMAEAQKMNPKVQVERRTAALLRQRAAEWSQPYSLQELDQARMNANARLRAFESAPANSQIATLRTKADVIADKAIADGSRDIVYDAMERHYGKDFRAMKLRQSAMLDVRQQLDQQMIDLANATAERKGAPLLSKNVSVYGRPEKGHLGTSIHSIQKIFTTPESQAGNAVRAAFPAPAHPIVRAAVMSMPLRMLLEQPMLKAGQPQQAPLPPAPSQTAARTPPTP